MAHESLMRGKMPGCGSRGSEIRGSRIREFGWTGAHELDQVETSLRMEAMGVSHLL